MTTGEKILHGGGYLIEDATAGTVFTPEDFSDEQLQLAESRIVAMSFCEPRSW